MFNYKKGLFISLLIGSTLLSSFAEADTPNAPGSYVGVSKLSNTSVRISTKDNSDNEDGFYASVYDYASSALVQRKVLPASNNSTVYANFTNLVCDKLYSANILAFNSDGNSSTSDTRYFNIHSTFSTTCPNNIDVPVAPGAYIGVTDINKSAVKVNFLDNSDNEDGFLLFDDSGDINITVPQNNTTAPSQTYVTLTGLTCDRVYTIKALAFNSNGNSATSDARAFNIYSTFGVTCDDTPISNHPPVANPQSITVDKDSIDNAITLVGTDADGDTLSYTATQPSHGTVTLVGAVAKYTPTADYVGTDSFTFKVNDGAVDSASATVSITIPNEEEPNHSPVANPQSVTVDKDSIDNVIALVGTDADGDTLSYTTTQPSHGTVTLIGAVAKYTPTANYVGEDSFTFKVNDGTVDSAPATVSITVANIEEVNLAKDNTLRDVSTPFNGLILKVTTDTQINTVSTSTIAIYGNVRGNNTGALLKLNSNYPNGTKFVVKVYEDNKLVGSSEELTYNGSPINFSDIN